MPTAIIPTDTATNITSEVTELTQPSDNDSASIVSITPSQPIEKHSTITDALTTIVPDITETLANVMEVDISEEDKMTGEVEGAGEDTLKMTTATCEGDVSVNNRHCVRQLTRGVSIKRVKSDKDYARVHW